MAFQNKGRRTPLGLNRRQNQLAPSGIKTRSPRPAGFKSKPGRRNRRFAPACHRFLVLLLQKVRASRLRTLLLQ